MEREDLIKKWLDNNLNSQEEKAFKALDDYKSLIKIANFSKEYTAPSFNKKEVLDAVLSNSKKKKENNSVWQKQLFKVAAVIAICFGTFYYTTTLDSNFSTDIAQRTSIELPDNSTVDLNAVSNVSYNKSKWSKNRAVVLEGEAFFKVAKGSTFNVLTTEGKVTVLGTQFNVKQRDNYFEVTCYEGLVEVTYNNSTTKLKLGESFVSLEGKTDKNTSITSNNPDWLNKYSAFNRIPLGEVLAELERQYNISINAHNIDITKKYTGKFPHDDLDTALKSILEPLQLNYIKKEKTITISGE